MREKERLEGRGERKGRGEGRGYSRERRSLEKTKTSFRFSIISLQKLSEEITYKRFANVWRNCHKLFGIIFSSMASKQKKNEIKKNSVSLKPTLIPRMDFEEVIKKKFNFAANSKTKYTLLLIDAIINHG